MKFSLSDKDVFKNGACVIFSEIYTAYWHLFIVVLAKYSAVKKNREVMDMAQIPEWFPERK